MKDVVKVKKEEKKVFTNLKGNDTIKKNHNPFKVNYKIYQRRDGLYMNNIELNKEIFIDEKKYQQAKKKMGKKNDYFSERELEEISVILA